jgi:hypothetical protein
MRIRYVYQSPRRYTVIGLWPSDGQNLRPRLRFVGIYCTHRAKEAQGNRHKAIQCVCKL